MGFSYLKESMYLTETGKLGAKPCGTPMAPNAHLTKDDAVPFDDPERYRRLVGKLNYLTVTRLDIAYAVSIVSHFMSIPTVKHWAALEQILCYLKGSPSLGILYRDHTHTRVECFVDTDWAGSRIDRKLTTSYCVFVGGNLVSWRSKKQNVVSRSSAESEYSAMAQSTCEILWIQHLLAEVGLNPLFQQNFGVIIRLFFTLPQIQCIMNGQNILRSIVTLSVRRLKRT
ncbi:secreted RxLR effector protein 161-like [Solanum verrucosum]|uniref:secreted RxLR effector protein 161-like n=1 Tax=Solanum verrucosum TaxID=315347 RepID=UPI0020D15ED7|nr:secreted RxLR effector protein 161-like [Solanum verrucosum]